MGYLVTFCPVCAEPQIMLDSEEFVTCSKGHVYRRYRTPNLTYPEGTFKEVTVTQETWVDRLQQEYDQVINRLIELGEFRVSSAFSELAWEDQTLLHRQFNAMQLYASILFERLVRIPAELV